MDKEATAAADDDGSCKELIFLIMILRVFSSGCTSFLGEPVHYMDFYRTLVCYARVCLMHHME